MNCIQTLEPGHPARPLLRDLESSALRCAWMASSLLTYSARKGVRPTPATVEHLVEIDALT